MIDYNSSLACVFIEKKYNIYSVNIIITPFQDREDAESVAKIVGEMMGVEEVIERDRLN